MINIAICDDNKKELDTTRELIVEYMMKRHVPFHISEFSSGEELLDNNKRFQVIFLDIAMGNGINGITTGKQVRTINRRTPIIYTTSFPQYCGQAINRVHAFGYLEKPLSKEELHMQLDEVLEFAEEESVKKQFVSFEVIEITGNGRVESEIIEFDVDEIYYFEYVNRRIMIKSINGEFYFMDQMKHLMEKMQGYKFESCHQSYLIHMKHVKKIKGYDLYMKNGDVLPVSQKKSAEFREKMNKFIQKSM